MSRHLTRTKNRSCDRKKSHDTWAEVNAHIDSLVAAGAYRPLLVGYPCKKCGRKHVGHRSMRKIKEETRRS